MQEARRKRKRGVWARLAQDTQDGTTNGDRPCVLDVNSEPGRKEGVTVRARASEARMADRR